MALFNYIEKTDLSLPSESLYEIEINNIKGEKIELIKFKGKKILFVNVASKCGYLNQYKDLQKLYENYKDKLVVIGLPCNQFGEQEPGANEEINSFCKINYEVSFLITQKVKAKGKYKHPVYKWLTQKDKNGKLDSSVEWNFQKYLIDEEGRLIDVFYSIIKPTSSRITKLI